MPAQLIFGYKFETNWIQEKEPDKKTVDLNPPMVKPFRLTYLAKGGGGGGVVANPLLIS